jgi:hypothetical protein
VESPQAERAPSRKTIKVERNRALEIFMDESSQKK